MSALAEGDLARALQLMAEDVVFATASTGSPDDDVWQGVAERRGGEYARQAHGQRVPRAGDGVDAYCVSLARVMAPIAPPAWVPMSDVLALGVTLEGGARGARSLFTSKPSDKEVQRVRRLGSLAARVATAVMNADGPLGGEERRLRAAFIASLGLPEGDERLLVDEAPMASTAIEIYGDLEPKIADAVVRGAWCAALHDGVDPREEEAIAVVAGRLGVPLQDAVNLRGEVQAEVEGRTAFGRLGADAVRFVLDDQRDVGLAFASLIAETIVASSARAEVLASARGGGPVVLGDRNPLDRKRRTAVLALAWAAALASNPSLVRRTELVARHDRAASDLGTAGEGARVRRQLDDFVDVRLTALRTTPGA